MPLIARFLPVAAIMLISGFSAAGLAAATDVDESQAPVPNTPHAAGTEKPVERIAREMSNPLAAFTSVTYRLEHRSFTGDIEGADDQTGTSHVMQAVLPFKQQDGQGFVVRLMLPYEPDKPIYWVDQDTWSEKGYPEWLIRQQDPGLQGEGVWESTHGHTGDMLADIVYGGVDSGGTILTYGMTARLPTSSDTSNARQQLVVGPLINVGKMTGWGTYGAMFSHVIDVVEKRDKGTPDTTISTIDAYFSYGLGNGWQLISSSKATYDWEADSGNKLSIPLGGGIAKTTRLGSMPLRIAAELQKYVVTTDRFSSDLFFQFSITPVLANKYTHY
jgi:hypothetical protein